MELAAAAGSAATVVQLADFAGRLIKSTTCFFAALADASKELEILHRRVQHLEQLFENTRALACSYQNTRLALEPQNQRSLDLLGQVLTKCSIDLQALNSVLQKPLSQTEWKVIRLKRRVGHVFDETKLKDLSTRLQDNIIAITSLLSSISMHNEAVIHSSVERVANLVEHFPQLSTQLSRLQEQNSAPMIGRLDRLSKALEDLALRSQVTTPDVIVFKDASSAENSIADVNGDHIAGFNPIGRFNTAGVLAGELFQALELFTPAFRTGMQFLYNDKQLHISTDAFRWILSEFHRLIAEVHGAAAQSYMQSSTSEDKPDDLIEALIPRRFSRKVEFEQKPCNQGDTDLSWIPAAILASPNFDHHKRALSCTGFVDTKFGELVARCEGTQWSKDWPFGVQESGFVNISFIPKLELNLPGIGITITKQSKVSYGSCHNFFTTFNVLPPGAPILQAIRAGDHGVSEALKLLKSGEYWAGDRDQKGRSLLSYAFESQSRDMCALLFRMGAHLEDLDTAPHRLLPAHKNILASYQQS